jgi:DNA-binding HxlR family transcriptional regulator
VLYLTYENTRTGTSKCIARGIRLIGDVWVLMIIINLLRGPKRFGELQAFMGHISSKTLTQRLRMLDELGFVQRRAFLEIPPRVEYHLTDKGQEFGEVIAAIELFAEKNLSDLAKAVTAVEMSSNQGTRI